MNRHSFRAVFFDGDGTLFNSQPVHLEGWRTGASTANVTLPPDWVALQNGVTNEAFAARLDLPQDKAKRFVQAKKDYVLANIASSTLFEGVVESLQRLVEYGVKLGLFTSSARCVVQALLKANPVLTSLFGQNVVTADEVGRRSKPDGFGLALLCETANVNSEDSVYVGDALTDWQACHHLFHQHGLRIPFIYACPSGTFDPSVAVLAFDVIREFQRDIPRIFLTDHH